MAQSGFTPILTYASNTAASVPSAGNLTNSANGSELAVNTADRRLFTKNSGGSVVELGTNPSALTVAGTTTLSALTASTALALNASKEVVSVTNTGSGNNVLATSPTLVTPILGTPTSVTLTNATGLPLSTGVTGTLATTNGGTGLTSFTSGGVVYASSTSALTTGSALTFDGANFATTGTSSGNRVIATSTSTSVIHFDTSASAYGKVGNSVSMGWEAGAQHIFNINTEQMRLTSTGLGIGTSSPARKLQVNSGEAVAARFTRSGGIVANNSLEWFDGTNAWYAGVSGSNFWGVGYNTSGAIDSAAIRLDSSGNLGLGVTPSAWASQPAIQQTGGAIWGINSANYELLQNAFYNGTNYIYRNTNLASRYNQNAGVHSWFTAPSGTAGNAISFTQAMTLDASGNLMVGGTNNDPFSRAFTGTRTVLGNNSGETGLTFRSGTGTTSYLEMGSGSTFLFSLSCNASGTQLQTTTAVPLIFGANSGERARISSDGTFRVKGAGVAGSTDAVQFSGSAPASAMTLDASGNLGVGTTSPTSGFRLDVQATDAKQRIESTTGTNSVQQRLVNTGGTFYTAIDSSAGAGFGAAYSAVLWHTGNYPMLFATNNTERARISSDGTFRVKGAGTAGSTDAFQVSGSAPADAARIDSSGNLGVGETSMGTIRLVVKKNDATSYSTSNMGAQTHTFLNNATNGGFSNLILGCVSATSGSAVYAGVAVVSEQASDTNGALAFGTRGSGGANITERARITSTGNVVAGGSVALATTATDGFLYVPTCAGTPTGVPTAITGMAPIVVNTTNNKLYFYSGGAWRDAGP